MPIDDREIATRLKAARVLRRRPEDKEALPVEALAELSPLPENELHRVWIGRVERAEVHATPMKLRALSEALGVPFWWFTVDDLFAYGPDPVREAPANGDGSQLREVIERLDTLIDALVDQEEPRADVNGDPGQPPGDAVEERAVRDAERQAKKWRRQDERGVRGRRTSGAGEEASEG